MKQVNAKQHNKKFLESKPRDALRYILRSDKKKYKDAKSKLRKDIQLLDNALALYIQALQDSHRRVDEWKDNESLRAAMAMADSVLHHLLLARYGVLRGYNPEVQGFLRACYERIARCFIFSQNANIAHTYLSGETIQQSEIDRKFRDILESKAPDIWVWLRTFYDLQSDHAHPNLKSLNVRTGGSQSVELETRVGAEHLFNIPWDQNYGKAGIHLVMTYAMLSLSIISHVVKIEDADKWRGELNRIASEWSEKWDTLSDIVPPDLRDKELSNVSSRYSYWESKKKKRR